MTSDSRRTRSRKGNVEKMRDLGPGREPSSAIAIQPRLMRKLPNSRRVSILSSANRLRGDVMKFENGQKMQISSTLGICLAALCITYGARAQETLETVKVNDTDRAYILGGKSRLYEVATFSGNGGHGDGAAADGRAGPSNRTRLAHPDKRRSRDLSGITAARADSEHSLVMIRRTELAWLHCPMPLRPREWMTSDGICSTLRSRWLSLRRNTNKSQLIPSCLMVTSVATNWHRLL